MNNRSLPYRLKPPENWEMMTKMLSESTFYLVSTSGPTCYTVRGEDSEKTFKVYIGDRQKCSCTKKAEVCIHLLYIMSKVLRIPLTNPMVWQVSLLDTEVTQLLDYREKLKEKRAQKHNYLKKKSAAVASNPEEEATAQRHEICPEEVCPICQEEMTEKDELTWCRKGCGTNVHAKCMQMFASHSRSNSKKVTCPLCRAEWGSTSAEAIQSEAAPDQGKKPPKPKKVNRPPFVGIHCRACKLKVLTVFHRCLVCYAKGPYDLCRHCYGSPSSLCSPLHPYVQAQARTDPTVWEVAASPSAVPSLPPDIIHQLQGRELTTEDYMLLLRLDQGSKNLHEQLLRSLPLIAPNAEEERKQSLAEALNPPKSGAEELMAESRKKEELKQLLTQDCVFCTGKLELKNSDPRAMPCNHGAHESCLIASCLEAMENQELDLCRCPVDGSALFPALRRRRQRPKTKPEGQRGTKSGANQKGGPKVSRRRATSETGDGNNLDLGLGLCGVGISGVQRAAEPILRSVSADPIARPARSSPGRSTKHKRKPNNESNLSTNTGGIGSGLVGNAINLDQTLQVPCTKDSSKQADALGLVTSTVSEQTRRGSDASSNSEKIGERGGHRTGRTGRRGRGFVRSRPFSREHPSRSVRRGRGGRSQPPQRLTVRTHRRDTGELGSPPTGSLDTGKGKQSLDAILTSCPMPVHTTALETESDSRPGTGRRPLSRKRSVVGPMGRGAKAGGPALAALLNNSPSPTARTGNVSDDGTPQQSAHSPTAITPGSGQELSRAEYSPRPRRRWDRKQLKGSPSAKSPSLPRVSQNLEIDVPPYLKMDGPSAVK